MSIFLFSLQFRGPSRGRSLVFDNLYRTQPGLAGEMEGNLNNNLLPQSLLFSGARGSSRLTAALDLASHLTSCRRDTMFSQNIIFFPYRDLYQRVRCAVNLFSSERTEKSRLFLIETLRLINMQYNSALSGVYPSSASKLFETAEKVDIYLTTIEDKKDITDKDIKELESLKLMNNIKYLYTGKSGPTSVSIDQLRAVKDWMAEGSDEKVVIIENIESSTEGAKNSILKMLEEPMEHLNIILISSESQRIMETILSRVRKFNFPSLSKESVERIIKEKFNTYESYSSFNTFFFARGNDRESVKKCEDEISYFVSAITGRERIDSLREEEIVNMLDKMNAYTYFMERVTESIERMTRCGRLECWRAKKILSVIAYWREAVGIYNLSGRSSIDYISRECNCV